MLLTVQVIVYHTGKNVVYTFNILICFLFLTLQHGIINESLSDISGYYPKNNPTGKREPGNSKYCVRGDDRHWQPLSEAVSVTGGFAAQMHVTPHIGSTAKTYLVDSVDDFGTVAPDPRYDYREEALQVVEQLKDTSSDETKKQKIAFYDDKLLVRGMIENEMRLQFGDTYSFEDELLFIYCIGLSEYDGTILTWREKVRHDLVRPTTVIQRWGSDVLNTFSGDKSAGKYLYPLYGLWRLKY